MKLSVQAMRSLRSSWHRHLIAAISVYGGPFLVLVWSLSAQTVEPQPTVTSTPVATPSATPNGTPTATPIGTPRITITPGTPSAAEIEAYNAARTPQVTVTFDANAAPFGDASRSGPAASRSASAVQMKITNGTCSPITLRPALAAGSKTSRASADGPAPQAQPVATVTLTYNGHAGDLVWVQMTRGGTLTATDGEGQTYDGSQGFFLTIGENGSTAFNYQAPNKNGTYQVLTRFSNVITTLPFLVPDSAP